MTIKTPMTAEPENRAGKARHNAAWATADQPRTSTTSKRMAVQTGHMIDGEKRISVADAAWPVWRRASLSR